MSRRLEDPRESPRASSRIHELRKMDEVEQALSEAANEFLRAGPASTTDAVAFFADFFKSKSSAAAVLRDEDDDRMIKIEEAINAALRTVLRDSAADPIRGGFPNPSPNL